jgi:hypothetical protein
MLIKILHPYLVSFICITSQFAPCIAQQLIIIPCASCQMMQLVVELSVEIQVYYMTVVVNGCYVEINIEKIIVLILE